MDKIYKILPKYAFFPILCAVATNMLAFYGTRPINQGMYHFDLSLGLDHMIPFLPQAVIIYVLAFITWIVGYIVTGRESREVCYQIMSAEIIAKLACLVIFLVLPTAMVRPEVTGSGFCNWLTRIIYAADTPDNLFPSVHCLENWIFFRASFRCKKVGRAYRVVMGVMALLVFASTLFIKQHLFLDVLGGVVVAEFGLWLSRLLRADRCFYALERRWGI